jgi:hypothetical protein
MQITVESFWKSRGCVLGMSYAGLFIHLRDVTASVLLPITHKRSETPVICFFSFGREKAGWEFS